MKASQLSAIGGFSILITLPPLPSTSSFPPRRHSTCIPHCFPCVALTTMRTRQSTPHFHAPSSNPTSSSPWNPNPSTPYLLLALPILRVGISVGVGVLPRIREPCLLNLCFELRSIAEANHKTTKP